MHINAHKYNKFNLLHMLKVGDWEQILSYINVHYPTDYCTELKGKYHAAENNAEKVLLQEHIINLVESTILEINGHLRHVQ